MVDRKDASRATYRFAETRLDGQRLVIKKAPTADQMRSSLWQKEVQLLKKLTQTVTFFLAAHHCQMA
jgi:hypothetical protein